MELHERLQINKSTLTEREPLAASLLEWYDQNKREMPWRATKDNRPTPYQVWVSEIMLQQTRVEAVREYYKRFISALPDVAALAAAPEDQLLKLWEGLGYYSRVRNMGKAARVVMEEYGGELPADWNQLLKLPGIGVYTAGAIASIAFGIPVPAPDGNVFRVLSRLLGSFAGLGDAKVKAAFGEVAARMMPPNRPGDFNQSLMELGATVCLPNGAPLCDRCPWQKACIACREESWPRLPVLPQKKPRRVEERTILLLASEKGLLLSRRPAKGLLAGLPEPLNLEGSRSPVELSELVEELGGQLGQVEELGKAVHIFSHIEWQMEGYAGWTSSFLPPEPYFWAEAQQLRRELAIPSAFKAYREAIWQLLEEESVSS